MGPVITPAPTAEPDDKSAGSPKLPQTTTSPSLNGDPPNQPAANDGARSTDSGSAGDTSDPAEISANTNDAPEDPSTGQDPAAAAPNAAHGYGGAEPQIIPQTTISVAGGQQSLGMGSVVYSALGGGQAPPGQGQPPPGTGQGGPALETAGTFYSLSPSGNLIAGTVSNQAPAAHAPTLLTLGASTYTANVASQFIIAGQTVAPGAEITVSGTPISLASGGTVAVIGTSTQSLGSASAIITDVPVLTFDGSTFTADASNDFIISGQTLAKGGVITIAGTPISYDEAGTAAVIGTNTKALGTAAITPADIMTVDGQVFTANPMAFSIDGTTISAGGLGVTISGTPISLEPGGSLIIDASTFALPTEAGLNPISFEGVQAKLTIPSRKWLLGYLGCLSSLEHRP
ncbi:hypothetical protein OEA41_003766 [Lepraria neglecta]|uniref:Uncharacterized protein n=1 Tax=Lepraria neglecta TaxID=209136 RepID=A0AAD9Z8E3_9LECA|nr:hypothetical protein OEA41_003766 [Lepraria neglecta]